MQSQIIVFAWAIPNVIISSTWNSVDLEEKAVLKILIKY